MAYELPPLPYAYDALEPFIDTMTMQIHHGKHHATYVANLNAVLEGHPDLQKLSVDDLVRNLASVPEAIRTGVRNNGGGVANDAALRYLNRLSDLLFVLARVEAGEAEPGTRRT